MSDQPQKSQSQSIASALQNLVAENASKAAEIARLKKDLDRSHRREAGWSDHEHGSGLI